MQTQPTLLTTAATTAQAAPRDGLGGINGDDFMKILIKQLQMQDPLKPMGNEEMVRQMSTIRELEMNTRMSSSLQTLTDQQRFGSAAALIGKYVNGTLTDEDGNEFKVEGTVTSVQFTEKGEAILQLDNGKALPMAKLQEVMNAPVPLTASVQAPPPTTAKVVTPTLLDWLTGTTSVN